MPVTELEKLSIMYWTRIAPAHSDAEEIAQAYRDGFRKAKELIADLHSEHGYGECRFDYWAIQNVGEKLEGSE